MRWGVPVFVMISGALFLSKNEISTKVIFSKYVLRIVTAFAAWSFIYYLVSKGEIAEQFVGLFSPGRVGRLAGIITSYYHLWFLPMIAGIYICLPIIKKISEDDKISNYFLIISFVFWFLLPQISQLVNDFGNEKMILITNAINGNINNMNMGLVCSYVFYFILGYKISKLELNQKQRTAIYLSGLCGFLFTIILSWALAIKMQTPLETYYSNTCINVFLEAVAIFTFLKNISFEQGLWYKKVILKISQYSFGIYLVHIIVIEQLGRLGITASRWNPVIAVPLVVCIVFIISLVI